MIRDAVAASLSGVTNSHYRKPARQGAAPPRRMMNSRRRIDQRGHTGETVRALPVVLHLIPLAAWISGVGAGLSLSGTVAALSACSIRRRGKSLGAGDDD